MIAADRLQYILNYLDRQNIASARLADIEEDLNITDVQYQTCVSILFVGYILMQVPSNMIVSKIKKPGIYICGAMALWGVISALMAVVKNYAGLLSARFFLGFIEAAFFPGALYVSLEKRRSMALIQMQNLTRASVPEHVLQPKAVCFENRHSLQRKSGRQRIRRVVCHRYSQARWQKWPGRLAMGKNVPTTDFASY